jgi:hypothetical protein
MSKETQGTVDGQLPPTLGEWRYFNPDGFHKLFAMTPLEFEKMPIGTQYALLALRSHLAKPARPKSFTDSAFASEEIAGGKATVTFRRPDGTLTTMPLVLEDGVWKLAGTRF